VRGGVGIGLVHAAAQVAIEQRASSDPRGVGDGEEPESQPKARTVFREELEREE
jgi:hypothetical protein